MKSLTRCRLLGIHVDAMQMQDFCNCIASAIYTQRRVVIGNHNLHSIYLYHRDPAMREFYKITDFVNIDGMAVVLLSKMLGLKLNRANRLAYLDFMDPVLQLAVANNWRVYYLGCKPGVIDRGLAELRKRHPGLNITGTDGYFDITKGTAECRARLQQIASFQPHLLVVGMGMPRQEAWIAENLDAIRANVILDAGGYLDYIAGIVPTAPRWLGMFCLEWLYRLAAEPRRLWRRYLVEPWFIAWLMMRAQWDRSLAAETLQLILPVPEKRAAAAAEHIDTAA